jgi:hypothetical protein
VKESWQLIMPELKCLTLSLETPMAARPNITILFSRGRLYKFLVNNRGERLIQKYNIPVEQDVAYKLIYAMGQEVRMGNGPILIIEID